MKILKKIAVLLCFTGFFHQVYSQKLTEFSHDSAKFLAQVEDYMVTGLADKSDVKDFINKFTLAWKSPDYTAYFKEATYRIADEMLAKKVQVYPTFQSFLLSMEYYIKSGLPEDKFDPWQKCVEKLLKQRPFNNLTTFLAMSESLFGSQIIFKTTTFSWSTNNTDYTFNSDSAVEIVFKRLDLKCTNEEKDTMIIYDTKGVYFPIKGTWTGEGGQTNWSRTGLEPNIVYAELKNYHITLKEGGFEADSVTFWDKTYFDKPLAGKIIEKNITEPKEKESYPRFVSYGKRFTIPNLTPDVTYNGGFSMRGRRFVGSGTREEPAELIFKRNDKPFLISQASDYSITKDNIKTDDARIIILLDGDSIYHPDIQMIYNINRKHVSLIRSTQGLSQAPFFDTYHKVSMFFEELSWYTDQSKMEFRMIEGNTQTTGDFESQDFFRPELFEKLRDPSGLSPLVQIAKYSKTINSRDMKVDDLANEMRSTTNDLYPTLFLLAKIGLVNLDLQQNTLHVQDKLFRFIDNRSGKADYDVVDYHSTNPGKVYKTDSATHREKVEFSGNDSTGTDNGIMNLNNFDITLNGISYVILSDSQNVRFYPENREMVLHRNREATFAGAVEAGRFTFFGKQFDFDYENFKIKMKNVDSLKLYATSFEQDSAGNRKLVEVKSIIRHLSGELLIDKTSNKSGLKQLKNYPIIISDTNTFVYYDKHNIQHGVYQKDNFYFKADPFTIDSLGSFSNSRLKFDGTFASADIVPEMRETLKLQPDFSLGFVHATPKEGLSLYKDKGKLFDTLKLSNRGLKGVGSLSYITSTSKSRDFTFFPDSMNARVEEFEVKEQKTDPEFPEAHGDSVYVHWLPQQDKMFATDTYNPFSCYNKFATFHGTFKLTPDLLSGNGRMDFLKAYLLSTEFKFKQHRVTADTADFNLRANDMSGIAFSTSNMKTDIDFEKKMGEFITNGKGSIVRFPQNQYIAYMDEFKWYIEQDAIEVGSKQQQVVTSEAKELQFSGSKFISVEPHQDSLQFITPSARYSLQTFEISAHQVPFIDVADARIVPDSGNITVHKQAVMDPLLNATVTANKVTKYYTIYNAHLNITSRKSYNGTGFSDYIDELKNKKRIYFDNIHVDTSHQTIGIANVMDSNNFALSPHFKYRGKVTLRASNPFYYFDGYTRINHDCESVKISWLKFSSEVDPNDIQIQIGQQLNESMIPLASSPIMTSTDSDHIYPTFLSPLVRYKSDVVIVPDSGGFLTFDKTTQQYRISSKEKLVEQSLPGNYVSLDTRQCILYGEGNLHLGPTFDMIDLKTIGNMTDYLTPDSITSSISMVLNFFFDDAAIEKMATDANGFSTLKPVDFTNATVQKNMREIMGKEEADKLISQLTIYGTAKKIPKELQSTLFLTNVNLTWNGSAHAYVSHGPIGIGSIGKTMVNKEVSGAIEIRRKRGLEELNIYLEFDPMHWYYFNYKGGLMQAVSSSEAFNTSIITVKNDKKTIKTDKGKYSYADGQPSSRTVFLKRVNNE